ncbi:OB-fold protein [Campylobacter mucosalis]|uniref:OB-fold protein n=1 Tax=Campylobacter mucosalis TaxID=202 RepID=UPI001470348D|nr:hypothetical protein [Campylobacter mucosalis]
MKKLAFIFLLALMCYAETDNKTAFYNFIIKDEINSFIDGGENRFFSNNDNFLATTSDKIIKEFKANELKAIKKFDDKNVIISGNVGSIRETATGNAQIIFATKQMMLENFSATLKKSETQKASELDQNQKVIIVCRQFRKSTFNMPMMHDCVMLDAFLQDFIDEVKNDQEKSKFLDAFYEIGQIATDGFKDIDLSTKKKVKKNLVKP